MAPQAAGGRLLSDTMGRLTFILFLLYSLPVGLHHLFMDPEQSTGFKFLQMALTVLVTVPTLLTVFTITASFEIAGRLRGGRGVFGWISALPWDRPMVLATGMSFVMLFFGGGGGIVNMSYSLNAVVHNTSWVTAHFHLIFGGTAVIMYFAIALAEAFGQERSLARVAAPPALAVVHRHVRYDLALALARSAGAVAPFCAIRLYEPDHCGLGPLGGCLSGRRLPAADQRLPLSLQSRELPLGRPPGLVCAHALCPPGGPPAAFPLS
jgi:hypothetical protein